MGSTGNNQGTISNRQYTMFSLVGGDEEFAETGPLEPTGKQLPRSGWGLGIREWGLEVGRGGIPIPNLQVGTLILGQPFEQPSAPALVPGGLGWGGLAGHGRNVSDCQHARPRVVVQFDGPVN